MKKVVICGDSDSGILTQTIVRACSNSGGVLYCDGKKMNEMVQNPEFIILSLPVLTEMNCRDGILILGNTLTHINQNIDLYGMIPVVDTSDRAALHFLSKKRISAVGCSMSSYDTLSLSGVKDFSSKLVSLQRSIRTVEGCILEPHEFVVRLSEEIPVYPLLAACAVLLLSGKSSSEGYWF